MDKMLRVILAIALIAILAVGLAISGCGGVTPDGGEPNGNEPNGGESNGNEPDISGLFIITGVSAGSASDLQIGEPAPDFWFENAEGQTTSLSDLKGKIVLVTFWTTTCTYCRMQMELLQQIYDEWPEEKLVLLVINVGESSDKVTSYVQDNNFSFPVLLDSEGEVAIRYGVPALPATLTIDKEGLLQEATVGAFQSKEEIESILNQFE